EPAFELYFSGPGKAESKEAWVLIEPVPRPDVGSVLFEEGPVKPIDVDVDLRANAWETHNTRIRLDPLEQLMSVAPITHRGQVSLRLRVDERQRDGALFEPACSDVLLQRG